jgi:hypothetical protein
MSYIAALCWFVAAAATWRAVCNERTYVQRSKMLQAIFREQRLGTLLPAYRAVSYHRHITQLMLFRDPREIYPEELRRFLRA